MPISQILLTAGSSGGSPSPAINIYGWTNRINEGSTNTVYVDYEDYPPTTIYWQIVNDGTANADWLDGTIPSGSFAINGTGSTSFSWTTAEDLTTEGDQNYLLEVGTTLGGNDLLNETLTINDTSLAAEPPFSLLFEENQNDYLEVAGSSDFNLGTTWTIEFWLNANAASSTAGGGIWGLLNQVGWSATNSVVVALSDNKLVFLSVANNANDDVRYTEPTPSRWTHVAIVNDAGTQKVFYNGSEQTRVSGNVGTASYTNGTDPLRIGRLGPQNGGTLNGKMAMVRISNTAKYSAPFTPTVTYGVDANTKLFLSSDTPLVDLSYYELNGVTTSASNGGTLYFSKATYPNLNNQIQLGNTVVNVDGTGASTSTTTGAVFTADPDNWGVTISPSQGAGTKNFSGARPRNAITNNGVTASTTFVNRYTATHSALNEGSSAVHIDSNPTNDAWAGSVPVGARIISSVTGRFIVNSRGRDGNNNWVFNIGAGPVFGFTAGETHTFIW
jgi:hypothetical protein